MFPLLGRFREQVINRFVSEYRAGNTPNPCIDCNRAINSGRAFGGGDGDAASMRWQLALCRVEQDVKTGRWLLKKALDDKKDQTYVLYQLTQQQLAHVLFPLGALRKQEVRAIASRYGLINAHKPDSQDICFVPDGDYAAFIRQDTGLTFPQRAIY